MKILLAIALLVPTLAVADVKNLNGLANLFESCSHELDAYGTPEEAFLNGEHCQYLAYPGMQEEADTIDRAISKAVVNGTLTEKDKKNIRRVYKHGNRIQAIGMRPTKDSI